MSWVTSETGDLLNLDHVSKLEVAAVERPEGSNEEIPSHCLIAYFPNEVTEWITSGPEDHCIRIREFIRNKLHCIYTR